MNRPHRCAWLVVVLMTVVLFALQQWTPQSFEPVEPDLKDVYFTTLRDQNLAKARSWAQARPGSALLS